MNLPLLAQAHHKELHNNYDAGDHNRHRREVKLRLLAGSVRRTYESLARHEHCATGGDVHAQRALVDEKRRSTFCRNQLPTRTAVIFGVDRINSSM